MDYENDSECTSSILFSNFPTKAWKSENNEEIKDVKAKVDDINLESSSTDDDDSTDELEDITPFTFELKRKKKVKVLAKNKCNILLAVPLGSTVKHRLINPSCLLYRAASESQNSAMQNFYTPPKKNEKKEVS